MNQDIEMLSTDDLNLQFNSNNIPVSSLTSSSEQQHQLNEAFAPSPHMHVPHEIGHIDENIESNDSDNAHSEQNDDDDEDEELFTNENETKTPGEILDEFCQKLEDINTTLPDSVINYYMRKSGFIVNDPKLVKIVSIASQKFIAEIVNDVWQRQRLKTKQGSGAASSANTVPSGAAAGSSAGGASTSGASESTKQAKTSASNANAANANASNTAQLTLEDLTQVLADYGINVKKPYYFI